MKDWIVRSTAAITLLAVITGCSMQTSAGSEPEEKVTPVQVALVEKGSLSLENHIFGQVKPSAEANVVPKLNGELTSLNVQKNQYVEKGAQLAVIDHESLQIQLKLQQFNVEQALEQFRNASKMDASQEQLDQAARVVEQAKLNLQLSELNIENAYMKAPISGVIAAVNAKQGEFVSAGTPLFKIVSTNPVRITANVSANQMLTVKDLKQINVAIPDLNKNVTAEITYVSPIADNAGFYTIEAEVDNPANDIIPGMTASFIMEKSLVQDSLLVPTKSIVEKAGKSSVFIIQDGKAAEKEVQVLEAQSDMTAIAGDITEQAQVVVKGQMTLTDGNKVTIIEEAR